MKIFLDKNFKTFNENYKNQASKLIEEYVNKYFRMQREYEEIDFLVPSKAEEDILFFIEDSQKEQSNTKMFLDNFFCFMKEEGKIGDISNAIMSPYSISLHIRDFFIKRKSVGSSYSQILDQIHLKKTNEEEKEDMVDENFEENPVNNSFDGTEEDKNRDEEISPDDNPMDTTEEEQDNNPKLSHNTTDFRKYLQKKICFLLPKAGDLNIFGQKITGNSSNKAKSSKRGIYRFIGSLKVLTKLAKHFFNKEKHLYCSHNVNIKDKVSGVVHHVKVTEKSVNVTLKELVLKLHERGKNKNSSKKIHIVLNFIFGL